MADVAAQRRATAAAARRGGLSRCCQWRGVGVGAGSVEFGMMLMLCEANVPLDAKEVRAIPHAGHRSRARASRVCSCTVVRVLTTVSQIGMDATLEIVFKAEACAVLLEQSLHAWVRRARSASGPPRDGAKHGVARLHPLHPRGGDDVATEDCEGFEVVVPFTDADVI